MKFDVIIIGSGLGSLLCGYILGREGLSVCILEKQPQPGGNLQTFTRHGHKFDTGVHYIGAAGPGQTLEKYWNFFGLMKNLSLQQLDPDGFDRVAFGEREFPLAQGFENFKEQLLQHFPDQKDALDAYVHKMQEVVSAFPLYNLALPGDHREHHYTGLSAGKTIDLLTSGHITGVNPALSSVLAGNNYLYGGSSATPLHVASLINHSFITGAYRIVGGSDVIWKTLAGLIHDQGGIIMTRTEVVSIERPQQQFIVTAKNREPFRATMVISGIHPAMTLAMLPPEVVRPAYYSRIISLRNTGSSFILYLSVKPGTFPYLNHNYYYHATENCWGESLLDKEDWPGMYLLTTGSSSPLPRYAETVTILTYMQYDEVAGWADSTVGHRGQAYLDFKMTRAERLLKLVSRNFPDLAASVDHMEISTPLTYRDYTGIPEGSLYGIERNFMAPEVTAVLPKTKIPNFYFTGQNTNLHGVLGVTIGAVSTCGSILGLDYLLKKINHV